jgi:flagellar basal body-associated protein FliL
MKRKTVLMIVFIITLLVAAAAYVYFFVYNKKNPDIENKKADFQVTAVEFIEDCEKLDTAANRKYNDKVIEIKGKVSSTIPGDSITSVVLDENKSTTITIEMYARFNDLAKNLKVGEEVTIKALYISYLPADPILISMGDSTARGDIKLKKGSLNK